MKLKNISYIFLFSIITLIFSQCKSDNNKNTDTETDDENIILDETEYFKNIEPGDLDAINEVIEGFASPVEMAAVIQDSDVPFAKKYLVETKIIDDYETNIKKALGLGLISADMGYLNIYERTALMVEYLLTIKGLADDLSIGQFFDFQSLKRLVDSSDNMDSLLFMTTNSFFSMDTYLRENERSYLSACLITGVWIEGFYLITQVAKETDNEDLDDQIGGQKDILAKLIHILKVFDEHPDFAKLVTSFEELQTAFEGVSVTVYKTEPIKKVTENGIVYYPSEYTIVEFDQATLDKIIVTAEKVRTSIVNLN
jgi:hypothetical protein